MQALYKKNGYSMAGACLPTILTLVVFIIAINGFTTFSNYQNKQYFYDMSVSYNQAFYDGFLYNGDDTPIVIEQNDEYFDVVMEGDDYAKISLKHSILQLDEVKNAVDGEEVTLSNSQFKVQKRSDGEAKFISVYNPKGYVKIEYDIAGDNLSTAKIYAVKDNLVGVTILGKTFEASANPVTFLNDIAATYSHDSYKNTNKSFLWIKNIWITDSPTQHPIIKDYKKFTSTYKYESGDISEAGYNNLISKLEKETKEPNGYFILVALTAISSLLMQIVTTKSQKAQMELQTVDGQGARTNKMMTWLMPIMMGVFAFTMTAAFSIYMIISSVFSIATTVLINKIVEKSLRKKVLATAEVSEGKEVIRGRVFVKEEPKVEPKKKTKKKDERVDFLNDKKENRRIRGRLK